MQIPSLYLIGFVYWPYIFNKFIKNIAIILLFFKSLLKEENIPEMEMIKNVLSEE